MEYPNGVVLRKKCLERSYPRARIVIRPLPFYCSQKHFPLPFLSLSLFGDILLGFNFSLP
jgi:hypothetical protein